MEDNRILDNDYVSDVGLSVTGTVRGYLEIAAKWGRFLGIVGFVVTGLSLLGVLGIGAAMGEFQQEFGNAFAMAPALFIVLYLISLVIFFFPILFLYNFSTSILRSLQNEEQIEFEKAFHNLKRLYQFLGILTAFILSFYVLAFIIALLG